MNARQMKKRLKRHIDTLQSDNILMHKIIADSPKMQELYDFYTKPINVTHTVMQFQEFRVKRMIPAYIEIYMKDDKDIIFEHIKQLVAEDLFEVIKKNITYDIIADDEDRPRSITGSIFIGKKEVTV